MFAKVQAYVYDQAIDRPTYDRELTTLDEALDQMRASWNSLLSWLREAKAWPPFETVNGAAPEIHSASCLLSGPPGSAAQEAIGRPVVEAADERPGPGLLRPDACGADGRPLRFRSLVQAR